MQVVAQTPENNHNDDMIMIKKSTNSLFYLLRYYTTNIQFYQIVTWKKESSTGHGTLKLLF